MDGHEAARDGTGDDALECHAPVPQFMLDIPDRGDDIAIIDGLTGEQLSYRQISERIAHGAGMLEHRKKGLALLFMRNDLGSMLCYLSLLRAGHAVCLAWPEMGLAKELIRQYRPEWILHPKSFPARPTQDVRYQPHGSLFGHEIVRLDPSAHETDIHPGLALVLSTSGSTGNPKSARLSCEGVSANARQICHALDIRPDDRFALSLPLQYCYGLSVLHSCLAAGAAVVITGHSVAESTFWNICRTAGVTALPTVPVMLTLMHNIGFETLELPALKKITVAGGAMDDVSRQWLLTRVLPTNRHVYPMYGMTEATARICVLSQEEFPVRPRSVGRPVKHGRIDITADGDIVYRGKNVMLGYARDRADLSLQDELKGVLNTGDLGFLDAEGYLYVTGRRTRMCKILGVRIDLGDVERSLATCGDIAAVSDDLRISIYHTPAAGEHLADQARRLADRLRIPRHSLELRCVPEIPRTANGKICYSDLRKLG